MSEQLDIDPLLREYLEHRRGLTGEEIDKLLVEWNREGTLTDFLASKALIDRTTARMLITAQKGYLMSTEQELRTVLGIKRKPKESPQEAAPAIESAKVALGIDRPKPEPSQDPTPPTPQPVVAEGSLVATNHDERSSQPQVSPVDRSETQPSAPPARNKKGNSGRRGFLGASEEELRHILRAKPGNPSTPTPQTQPPPTSVVTARTASTASAAAAEPVAPKPEVPAAKPRTPERPPITSGSSLPSHSDPQIQSAIHSGTDLAPIKASTAGTEPKVGAYLDRYYLEESLGEGATAHIFRSFHKLLRIPVAIKAYKREAMASDPIGAQRFLSEAQILIRLEHPNIVRVLDIAVRDGAPYIVFEYVGELSLQGMINNMGHLPPLRVAQIGAQVAAALEVASSHGLLHRDVKPDNVLIRKDGLAKLADFGIATHRASDGRTDDELARAGLISGTPQYISPEQIMTPDQIDFRADMYSLGATLYHAASGHPPFERESIDEMLHAQLEDTPVPVVTLDPNFDPELSNIIDQLLHKEPRERFASLSEVRKRMEAAAIRIQLEATLKRRSALSSGTLPTLRLHEEASATASATPDSGRLAARSHSSPKAQSSSGSQSPLQASSQLVLREPNLALRIGLIVAGLIISTIVLLVLIRTSR